MQPLPAPKPELADRVAGGGDGQRHHQHQRQEPDGDERPLDDVIHHQAQVEHLVDERIDQEVQTCIEERQQAQLDLLQTAGQLDKVWQ